MSRYEEEIDELQERLSGRELVVRFPMRFALRFAFMGSGLHKLTLSSPGRARVDLGVTESCGYPAAFRREEFLAVVDCLRRTRMAGRSTPIA